MSAMPPSGVEACGFPRERVTEFVAGDLDRAAADAVREHLRGCAACRRDAASLQQAGKALRSFAAAAPAAVGESFFAGMQRSILTRIERECVEGRAADTIGGRRRRVGSVLTSVLAAAACFLVGWWLVQPGGAGIDRWFPAGRATPVTGARHAVDAPFAVEGPRVVPWAGGRVVLQPLSLSDETHVGAGMMERLRLRSLEQWAAGMAPMQPASPDVEPPVAPPRSRQAPR